MGNNDNYYYGDQNHYNNDFHNSFNKEQSFSKNIEIRKRRWKEATPARKVAEIILAVIVLLIIL
ncbi:MAG TPA: hypothetical protein VM577_16450 [Anaerovoracaceae bacterium]|nr:hypothetical protein [Anaerovoracaceae bacterium]